MFLLAKKEEQTVRFGDGLVRYREATAREYRDILQDPRFRDPATQLVDDFAAHHEILRLHITGWELKDAAGLDLPFTPTNLDFVLLNCSPIGWGKLKDVILSGFRESSASGKDSGTDSNG